MVIRGGASGDKWAEQVASLGGAVGIMVGGWGRQGDSSKRGSSFYPCRIKP